MAHFLIYVGTINPWFPGAMIPAAGWVATVAEIVLGVLLLIGFRTRWAARISGWLLLASVLAASGGAFLLAAAKRYVWSIDEVRRF